MRFQALSLILITTQSWLNPRGCKVWRSRRVPTKKIFAEWLGKVEFEGRENFTHSVDTGSDWLMLFLTLELPEVELYEFTNRVLILLFTTTRILKCSRIDHQGSYRFFGIQLWTITEISTANWSVMMYTRCSFYNVKCKSQTDPSHLQAQKDRHVGSSHVWFLSRSWTLPLISFQLETW